MQEKLRETVEVYTLLFASHIKGVMADYISVSENREKALKDVEKMKLAISGIIFAESKTLH